MSHLEALTCSNLILKTLDYFAKKDSRPISVDVTLISLLLALYILLSVVGLNTNNYMLLPVNLCIESKYSKTWDRKTPCKLHI